MGYRNIKQGNQQSENTKILNRDPWHHVPNIMVMNELVEEEIELERNVEEQENIPQKDMHSSRLEDNLFLPTTDEAFEYEQLLFEDDMCQYNVVQIKLDKAPL